MRREEDYPAVIITLTGFFCADVPRQRKRNRDETTQYLMANGKLGNLINETLHVALLCA